MRVLLVKSRSIVSKVSAVHPPLGVMSLAAFLRDRMGADVRILDLKFHADPMASLADSVRSFEPGLVGISALTPEGKMADMAADTVKGIAPSMPVVAGGPHATAFTDESLANPNVDAVVVGEGEETLLELAQLVQSEGPAWNREDNLAGVAGIAYRTEAFPEGTISRTPLRPFVEDLDSLPLPAWDLLDLPAYWRYPGMASIGIRPYMAIFTSRGCPYRCAYCHNLFGKRFRARSSASVIEELRRIRDEVGVQDIEVVDDIANLDKQRLDSILSGLLERDMHPLLSFPNALRTDILEADTVDLLKQVGVGEISVAVETASQRLQKLVGKNLNLDRVRTNTELLTRHKIFTRGFFMVGFPTESEAELKETIRFACDSPMHLALFFTVNPFKDTPLYRMYQEAGKLSESEETIDYEYYGAPFNGSDIPDDKFQRLVRNGYYRFYLNPVRMARIARDRPYKRDIPMRAWGVFRQLASFRRLKE